MASYLVDLDGTFFKFGTMVPIDGSVEFVRGLISVGHQVVFITKRSEPPNVPPSLDLNLTKQVLDDLGFGKCPVIGNIDSPRIVINDDGANAINWIRDNCYVTQLEAITRFTRSLRTLAWTNKRTGYVDDWDDYIQTIILARSLLECNGFNHRDFVSKFRQDTSKISSRWAELGVPPGGVGLGYHGSIYRLRQSIDPLYQDNTGLVSDGSAMRSSALAAYYLNDLEKMSCAVKQSASVTHGTAEAVAMTLLVVLRYRQALLGGGDLDSLMHEYFTMTKYLQLDNLSFLQKIIDKAIVIYKDTPDPADLLVRLAKEVGINHYCWCCPLSAVVWSYRLDNILPWHRHEPTDGHPKRIVVGEFVLQDDPLDIKIKQLYKEHEGDLGKHRWVNTLDWDTLYSIAFSIVAADRETDINKNELVACDEFFGDQLENLATSLVIN